MNKILINLSQTVIKLVQTKNFKINNSQLWTNFAMMQ